MQIKVVYLPTAIIENSNFWINDGEATSQGAVNYKRNSFFLLIKSLGKIHTALSRFYFINEPDLSYELSWKWFLNSTNHRADKFDTVEEIIV